LDLELFLPPWKTEGEKWKGTSRNTVSSVEEMIDERLVWVASGLQSPIRNSSKIKDF
jgi:hypothetical protein